jgi:hypothetical protein
VKVGRNDSCPCGSGIKYKRCCLPTDQAKSPEFERHKEMHAAFHEAGHALMTVLFGERLMHLKYVFLIPVPAKMAVEELAEFRARDGVAGTVSIPHHEDLDEEARCELAYQDAASTLAGDTAEKLFCHCHTGGDEGDREDLEPIFANVSKEDQQRTAVAVTAAIERHRPQLDAIAAALIKHKFLTGPKVKEVMAASGWNPETDADPDQFYNEALGIAVDETEAA